MSDAVERVLVVPRHVVPDRAAWYGLRTSGIDDFLAVVEAHGRYEPRSEMEVDPGFKQIIPYLVLRDGERISSCVAPGPVAMRDCTTAGRSA
jgi:predicted NUDIX family phosphoesterase